MLIVVVNSNECNDICNCHWLVVVIIIIKKPSKSDKLFYENEHSMQTHGTT